MAEALAGRGAVRVLLLGGGDGRNGAALRERGIAVDVVAAGQTIASLAGPYDGALSTHDLLHGTRQVVANRIAAIARLLVPAGRLHATFGSTADPRYGAGGPIAGGDGWAPIEGGEAGVAHAYFAEAELRAALGAYDVLSLEERDVTATVGRWAHSSAAAPIVHWLVEARLRPLHGVTPAVAAGRSSTA